MFRRSGHRFADQEHAPINPRAQAATIASLIAAGADPDAIDKSEVTPLHRAVRTRCAAAVGALLDASAGARRSNRNGSTPMLHEALVCFAPA